MTLSELKTALKRYGFDDTDPLTVWLNEAKNRLEDAYPWPFLETEVVDSLAAGTGTLTLPGDFVTAISVRVDYDTYVQPLTYLDAEAFDRETGGDVGQGIVENYTIIGQSVLKVWRVPDADLSVILRYSKSIADMSDGAPSASPALPSRLHYAIVEGAAAIGLQAENEEERAQTAADEFQSSIDRAILRLGRKQPGFTTVSDTQGYGDGC